MHFRIVHELEIPRDAVELAVLSPDLGRKLADRLPSMQITQRKHRMEGSALERTWYFKANVRLPRFAKGVTPEMSSWLERWTYDLEAHRAEWLIVPVRLAWRKYFRAEGSYSLDATGEARTRRTIEGDLHLNVPVVSRVAERMILGEVEKIFEAEVETLREVATLS